MGDSCLTVTIKDGKTTFLALVENGCGKVTSTIGVSLTDCPTCHHLGGKKAVPVFDEASQAAIGYSAGSAAIAGYAGSSTGAGYTGSGASSTYAGSSTGAGYAGSGASAGYTGSSTVSTYTGSGTGAG